MKTYALLITLLGLSLASSASASEIITTPEVVIPPISNEPAQKEQLSPPPRYNQKRAADFQSLGVPDNFKSVEKELRAIDSYLTSFKDLQSEFVQYSGKSSTISKGKFYIKRPGKTRWEYATPKPSILFINNGKLVFYDLELQQVSYKSIPDNPLQQILFEKTSIFDDNIRILEVVNRPDTLNITLTTAENVNEEKRELGFERITFVFNPEPLELVRVQTVDKRNAMTQYDLRRLELDVGLKDSLFKFVDKRPLKGKRN